MVKAETNKDHHKQLRILVAEDSEINQRLIGCFQIRLRFTRLWWADYNRND